MSNDQDAAGSVRIERTFAAPIDTVWNMWTEGENFQNWYGPQGATIPVANMDAEVGGKRLVCMEMDTPNGKMQMWFAGEYLEVNPTSRLVYTEAMADENGTIKSPQEMGMPEGSPESTQVVVELTAHGDETQMTMTHIGVPAGSPGEAGWQMAIEKLAALLS